MSLQITMKGNRRGPFLLLISMVFASFFFGGESNDVGTQQRSFGQGIAFVLEKVLSQISECSLLILYEEDSQELLHQILVQKNMMDHPKSFHSFQEILPQSNTSFDATNKFIIDQIDLLRQDTCSNYLILSEDSLRVPKILSVLHDHKALSLKSKFVVVTNIEGVTQKLGFLQLSPLDWMTNLLVLTPRDSGISLTDADAWQLWTHSFFSSLEKRIDLLFIGNFQEGQLSVPEDQSHLFPKKLRNFSRFQFRVSTFHYPPVVVLDSSGRGKHDGLEVRIINAIAEALNFQTVLENPRDGDQWGSLQSNGSWTGAIGEVVRREAEVSFANYFITRDRLDFVDMTSSHSIDYTCFITPMPDPPPQYSAVVWPFQGWVWMTLLFILLMMPLVLRVTSLFENGSRLLWYKSIDNCAFYVWGIQMNQSQRPNLLPRSSSQRIVYILFAISALVVSVAYRSALFSFLLVPAPPRPVNTLEELLHSGLQWGVRDRGGWQSWFSDSTDPTSQKIYEGFQFVRGIEGGIERVLNGDFAFMNSGRYLKYLVASNFTDKFGQAQLHITKECFVPFRIGFATPLNSVYTDRFSEAIGRLVEAGLVTKWFNDLVDQAAQLQRLKAKEQLGDSSQDTVSAGLGLHQLQGAFMVFGLGIGISLGLFLLEVVSKKHCKDKNEKH